MTWEDGLRLGLEVLGNGTVVAVGVWVVKAVRSKLKSDGEALGSIYWDLIRKQLEDAVEKAGAENVRVIDLRFQEGLFFAVPIILDRWLQVLPEGAEVMGDRFGTSVTEYFLRCNHPTRLKDHCHLCEEVVTVLQGEMTDLNTGKVYRMGETWVVPAGEWHAVRFDAPARGHGLFKVAVKPPLGSPLQTPLQLSDISKYSGL